LIVPTLKVRRKERMAADSRNGNDAVLEWLPERLEHRARELRDLVQEKHTSMRECAGMSLEGVTLRLDEMQLP
jgi:hypothetical protein